MTLGEGLVGVVPQEEKSRAAGPSVASSQTSFAACSNIGPFRTDSQRGHGGARVSTHQHMQTKKPTWTGARLAHGGCSGLDGFIVVVVVEGPLVASISVILVVTARGDGAVTQQREDSEHNSA